MKSLQAKKDAGEFFFLNFDVLDDQKKKYFDLKPAPQKSNPLELKDVQLNMQNSSIKSQILDKQN